MSKKAFTLIELMVVMAIIAVLAVLIIGAITIARRTAEETMHRNNAKTIQTGLERYFSLYRSYCQPLGSTTPGITCYSGSHSFQWIAASLTDLNQGINVNLSSTNCDTGEATYNNLLVNKAFAKGGGNNLYGGGYVKDLSANGLTIMPVAYDCSTALDSEKIVLP